MSSRVARERRPAERADASAEERAHVGGHEAGECERVLDAVVVCDLADVVAVVEDGNAELPEFEHRLDVLRHRLARRRLDRGRIVGVLPLLDGPALRQVAVDRIVRRGLVGDGIRTHAPPQHLRQHFRRIAEQSDRDRFSVSPGAREDLERFVQCLRAGVEIARVETLLDAVGPAFDREHRRARHRGRERLRAAHAAEPCREDPLAGEVAAEVLATHFDERLVGALHDALAADVDPRAGRHLAVHHQALAIELVEVLPGGPAADEVRVRDQHARRVGVRAEHADRLARLHQQRFVVAEFAQRLDDAVVAVPVARGTADAAVDDEVVGPLGHVRVEVVHQHAQRGLGEPAAGGKRGAAGSPDRATGGAMQVVHGRRYIIRPVVRIGSCP